MPHARRFVAPARSLRHCEVAVSAAIIDRALQALRTGDVDTAIRAIESAPAATRNTQAAQRTLAAAQAQRGDLTSADAAIQRALRYPSLEPATRALAGRIALDRKQPEQAFQHFEALVQLLPQQMAFWRFLWDAATTPLSQQRALQLVRAASLDASADVHVARATARALADTGAVAEALTLGRDTAVRHPQSNIARWLWLRRLVDEAPLDAWRELQAPPARALEALPREATLDADAVDAALVVPEQYPDDAAIDRWRERYGSGLRAILDRLPQTTLTDPQRAGLVRHTAFRLAYHGRDDRALQTLRGDLLAMLMQPLTPPSLSPPVPRDKLRVAFASKHLRDCTVGHYFKRFFTDLADGRIEVFVYACGDRDAFTDEVASRATLRHFADDDAALLAIAGAIAADAPDVLIYPEIGMEPLIEKLAAMRLAPLQCAMWGHPVTTGLPTIDVFVSAAALEPADAVTHYRERLHLLPGLGTCYPTPPAASALSRAALGLPATGTLAICAQSPFKWSPQFTRTVGEILVASPEATLLVFDSPIASRSRVFDAYLQHHFAPLGVEIARRVLRLPQRSRADFLAVLAHSDLALDSFGFSGGNTSLDALSVGLPVLTLPGEFMRGRQTMAMLRCLPERVSSALLATDAADYVLRARRLLTDSALRAGLRAAITASASALFNDPAPVPALRAWLHDQQIAHRE